MEHCLKFKTGAPILVKSGELTVRETRGCVGGDDFVFSHRENSTVSVPVWMVKTGLAAGQTFTFAPQLKVKRNKAPSF